MLTYALLYFCLSFQLVSIYSKAHDIIIRRMMTLRRAGTLLYFQISISIIRRHSPSLLIVDFFRQGQVQNNSKECRHRKPSLHHQHDSVKETKQCTIISCIRENISEPSWDQSSTEPKRHGCSENEAVAASECHSRDNP